MKFKFIGNACGIFTGSKGTKILCDPWIVNGVFEGSWFHYPPLKTNMNDIQHVDAIYVSHIHPDHYDHRNFNFSKNIPIILLDEGGNFLKKNLITKGYNNFVEIKDNQSKKFNEFYLTMYKPFAGHLYEESLLGNLIDSSLVLEDQNITAINFNDNTPNIEACKKIRERFDNIDLAMLNYNAAGSYPSCYQNLNEIQKKQEHFRILKRNFDHLCQIIPILNPKTVLPFAGAYVIGGKNSHKNKYLGTTTWDECAEYLRENLKNDTNITCLRENQTFDLINQKNLEKYEKVNLNHMKKYINDIKNVKYDYENDEHPNIDELKKDIDSVKKKFKDKIKKFNLKINSNVYLNISDKKIKIIDGEDPNRELTCTMDLRLLKRIINRESHWNNAEVGAHIEFFRKPNKMDPDVHTSLSFFHL